MTAEVVITARKDNKVAKVDGQRVHFSTHRCFAFDDGPEDLQCLARLEEFLSGKRGLAIFAEGPLLGYLLKHAPSLASHLVGVIAFKDKLDPAAIAIPV